jgi:DNA polymerase delta subunit 1
MAPVTAHLGTAAYTANLHKAPGSFKPAYLQAFHVTKRRRVSIPAQKVLLVRAAAAGAFPPSSSSDEDPYQVLGLQANADSEAVGRQYNKKKRELRGNQAALDRLESAHSRIMMRQLTARMQGGVKVDKDIRFADRPQYLPWRPRVFQAGKKFIMYVGIVQALLLAWGGLVPLSAGSQPVVAACVAGAVANVLKLNALFPAPSSSSASEAEKKQGIRNVIRGGILAVIATFIGCALTWTLPDFFASQLGKELPYWFYANETRLLTLGTTVGNFVMSAFFR